MNYNPHELCKKTFEAVGREREATLVVLKYLRRVDKAKAYLELGYSSLFSFCVTYLKYSESAAQRRIQASRLLSDLGSEHTQPVKELEEKIQTGKLNLSQLATAQKVLLHQRYKVKNSPNQKEKLPLLTEFEALSTRECEKKAHDITGSYIPKKDTWQQGAGEDLRLSVTIDQETKQLLERFKELTAHKNPLATTSNALKLALEIAISKVDPAMNPPRKKISQKTVSPINSVSNRTAGTVVKSLSINKHNTRGAISKTLKHDVHLRDESECSWIDHKTGKKCGSKFKLQIDHKYPVSRGGKTELDNLQLLCANHNLYKSNRIL